MQIDKRLKNISKEPPKDIGVIRPALKSEDGIIVDAHHSPQKSAFSLVSSVDSSIVNNDAKSLESRYKNFP